MGKRKEFFSEVVFLLSMGRRVWPSLALLNKSSLVMKMERCKRGAKGSCVYSCIYSWLAVKCSEEKFFHICLK